MCSMGLSRVSGDKNLEPDNQTIFQAMQRRDFQGRDCIANKSALAFDCLPSCNGIYADTSKWWDWDPIGLKKLIQPLLSEYEKFKRSNVRHLRFNSSLGSTLFGM